MKKSVSQSRRDDILLTVGFNLRKMSAIPAQQNPAVRDDTFALDNGSCFFNIVIFATESTC